MPLECGATTVRYHYSTVPLQRTSTIVRCHYRAVPLPLQQCGGVGTRSGPKGSDLAELLSRGSTHTVPNAIPIPFPCVSTFYSVYA